ncbi:hypothetical protein LCGC14_0146220 [marine sediment metagenome]|uniref:Uncharacterized protein n=1 Tax=marine sediment metagenome TaxID=412755 RepID=A0A0F9XHH5_9ZZZZ
MINIDLSKFTELDDIKKSIEKIRNMYHTFNRHRAELLQILKKDKGCEYCCSWHSLTRDDRRQIANLIELTNILLKFIESLHELKIPTYPSILFKEEGFETNHRGVTIIHRLEFGTSKKTYKIRE